MQSSPEEMLSVHVTLLMKSFTQVSPEIRPPPPKKKKKILKKDEKVVVQGKVWRTWSQIQLVKLNI